MGSRVRSGRNPLVGCVLGAWLLGCANADRGSATTGEAGASGNSSACTEQLDLRIGEFREEDQPLERLEPGDPLHLWSAPQGGHVVTVAAEVRGLANSIVYIEARLLDRETEAVVKDDSRSIVMQPIAGDAGWMSPDIRSRSQVAHIALCPGNEQNLVGSEFWLEIEIREVESDCGRAGVARVPVVPRCLQEGTTERAYCECQCDPSSNGDCSR